MSFLEKNEAASDLVVPPEMYHSVHVMQDDVDALSGKTVVSPSVSSSGAEDSNHPFLREDSPFGTSGTPEVVSEKKTEPLRAPKPAVETKKYVLYGGIISLSLLVVSVAAYFFFVGRKSPSEPSVSPVPVVDEGSTPSDPSMNPQDGTASGYYSATNPNYLMLDVESSAGTPEGIARVFSEAAVKVLAMNASGPVEFVIVDKNNTPIAFSRFIYLAGLKLPDDLVSLAGESFSIYMMQDGSTIHFGTSVDLVDAEKAMVSLKQAEPVLPTFFQGILYGGGTVVPALSTFRSGTYGTLETRFAVIDGPSNLSFDYVVLGKKLVVGTSKNSFQAILTKLVQNGIK